MTTKQITGGIARRRIVQLVARAITVLLSAAAVYAGADEGQVNATLTEYGDVILYGAGAAVGAVVDLLIHRGDTGGVMKPAGNKRKGKP